MPLSLPRRSDLSVLALDLLDQELDESPSLVDVQIHDFSPRPVEMVGQEKNFFAKVFLVYSKDKKCVISRFALNVPPQLVQVTSRIKSTPGAA